MELSVLETDAMMSDGRWSELQIKDQIETDTNTNTKGEVTYR